LFYQQFIFKRRRKREKHMSSSTTARIQVKEEEKTAFSYMQLFFLLDKESR
jgi:hypothetical protein